jgi:hypothetical protein
MDLSNKAAILRRAKKVDADLPTVQKFLESVSYAFATNGNSKFWRDYGTVARGTCKDTSDTLELITKDVRNMDTLRYDTVTRIDRIHYDETLPMGFKHTREAEHIKAG